MLLQALPLILAGLGASRAAECPAGNGVDYGLCANDGCGDREGTMVCVSCTTGVPNRAEAADGQTEPACITKAECVAEGHGMLGGEALGDSTIEACLPLACPAKDDDPLFAGCAACLQELDQAGPPRASAARPASKGSWKTPCPTAGRPTA